MKKNPTHGTGDGSRRNLPDDPEQSKRFEETARELSAHENGKEFEQLIQAIAPAMVAKQSARRRERKA